MEEKKQKWIVRRYLAGMPTKLIAAHQQIPICSTYRVIKHYKSFGTIKPTNLFYTFKFISCF